MTFDGLDVADPWIALTAVALATERLRLGRDGHAAGAPAPVGRRAPGRRPRPALGRAHGLRRRPRRRQPARADAPSARSATRAPARRCSTRRSSSWSTLWRGEPVTRDGAAFALDERRGAPDAAAAAAPAGVAGLRVAQPPPARARGALRRRLPGQPRRAADRRRRARAARDRRRAPRRGRRAVRRRARQPRAPPTPTRLAELGAAGATWWLQGFGERPRLADVQDAAAAGPPQ